MQGAGLEKSKSGVHTTELKNPSTGKKKTWQVGPMTSPGESIARASYLPGPP